MYTSFYGLKEKPFNLNPDPSYLFWSSGHENAYTHLEYAITENKGFGVITGEVGSGKTTLINHLIHQIPKDLHLALINNPDVSPAQLLKMICTEYELDTTGDDKASLLENIYEFLIQTYANQQRAILIIDEAQNLPAETIEEIRMLSNREAEKEHLIQIILVGQPELKEKLQRRSLRQFTQRVSVHAHLGGLTADDVNRYIRHRLKVAGADNPELFTEEAIQALHTYSEGIPRLINILCDTALVYGFADELQSIDRPVIDQVMTDRKSGGILLAEQQAGTGNIQETISERMAGGTDKDSLSAMEKRLRSLEHQVQLLGTLTENLEQQLNYLGNHRSEQDQLLREMLQLLKENLNSRFKMTAKAYQLREKYLLSRQQPPPASPPPSFFSRLRKKK
ncbi:MAG: general secretion pathway protein GspA [Deltaproteobacteria bacterium]|nr:MAG: general secretion pathway protein GspA [Deltaproteobacteria bacterium]